MKRPNRFFLLLICLAFFTGCAQSAEQPPEETGAAASTIHNTVVKIIDRTKEEGFSYDTALEKFFEDAENEYFFSGIYSEYILAEYTDGTQRTVAEALAREDMTIADLDRFGVRYIMTPKQQEPPAEMHIPKEPPELTVLCDEKTVTAMRGTSSWTYAQQDGTSVSICADSMHPLSAKEHMPVLDLLPSYFSHIDPLAAYLHWDITPDTVFVRAWNEADWGAADAAGEELAVKMPAPDFADFTVSLKDGNYIYEVIAEWNTQESFGGTASYSFCTAKPIWNTQPIGDVTYEG